MPFKSKAQQRFMFAAEARGELPKGKALEWAHETKNIKKLPEYKKMKKTAEQIAEEVTAKVAAWSDEKTRAARRANCPAGQDPKEQEARRKANREASDSRRASRMSQRQTRMKTAADIANKVIDIINSSSRTI